MMFSSEPLRPPPILSVTGSGAVVGLAAAGWVGGAAGVADGPAGAAAVGWAAGFAAGAVTAGAAGAQAAASSRTGKLTRHHHVDVARSSESKAERIYILRIACDSGYGRA